MKNTFASKKLKGLYAITDEILTSKDKMLDMAYVGLKNGVKVLQLRDKNSKDDDLLDISLKLKDICSKFNALFIINDRVSLAKKVNANGVHIGAQDMQYIGAREYLGEDKIIGVSCYGDINKAMEYEKLGADYVAFGAFFKSPTKKNAKIIDISILDKAKQKLKIPICAIGGINKNNIYFLKGKSDMIACISALWNGDIAKNTNDLKYLYGIA